MIGGAPVLPYDGVAQRFAAGAIPQQRGFALIGDADRGNVLRRNAGVAQRLHSRCILRFPQIARIVFHPAGLREMLRKFALRKGQHVRMLVEDDSTRTGRALVERQDNGQV